MIGFRRCLLLLLFVLPLFAAAQEMRTVNGRKCIVHMVAAHETLYAIARAYAVPVEELMVVNPTAAQGLRIGQELLVPKDAVVKKESKHAPVLSVDGELRHIAKKKETLFGIARLYNVEVADLLERNPNLATGLPEGMEVIIPVAKVKGTVATVLQPADSEHAVDHVVREGETLYSLGQRYGVKPEEIQAANGGLPQGLKTGTLLRIPKHEEPGESAPVPPSDRPAQGRYKVAFLLPFSIERNDSTLEASTLAEGGPHFYEPARIAAQFYAGAQLALDSLQQLGLLADVTVKDVGDDATTWGAAIKDPELADMDLFIGPFHRSAIEQLTRTHPLTRVICPVPQSNKVVLGNPQVSKVATSRSDLVKQAGRYVASRFANENILLVRPDIATEKELQEQAASAINTVLAARSVRLRDSVAVVKTGRRDIGELASHLDHARVNVVVVPSEDVEYVANLVTRLKPLANKDSILLVGMESWLGMDPLSATDLDRLGLHFAASTFVDNADPKVVHFTREFRDRFHADIDEYALLGFDVTYHFVHELMEDGPVLPDGASQDPGEVLHMGFRMGRTGPENGLRNEYAVVLRQRDLRLERAP